MYIFVKYIVDLMFCCVEEKQTIKHNTKTKKNDADKIPDS